MARPNLLLAALSEDERRSLDAFLKPVQLRFKDVLYEPEQRIRQAYFVTRGVVSLVNEPDAGQIVEVATIGREGVVGLPALLGAESSSNRAIVQIPGEGLRASIAEVRTFQRSHPSLQNLLMRYAVALLNQISQNASCNRLHEVQERCARWLLQTRDRVDADTFPLTQEFLAQMLGVHRPTVSIAAGMLQKAGVIRYVRGTVTIVDREGLEDASCSCYRFIRQEYERALVTAQEPLDEREAGC